MKVFIKETGNFEELSITNPKTGINCTIDFISNAGGRYQLEWDDERNAYICNQETLDWLNKALADNQALENSIHELVELHGYDAVSRAINKAGNVDTESFAYCVDNYLDDHFVKIN